MNRIALLLADLKAKSMFRQVMMKHQMDFATQVPQKEVQNATTPQAPEIPTDQPSGYSPNNGQPG
jgi:hypothetical protein